LSYEALVSVLFGAAISGAISWYFYRQASDDLKDIHDCTARMLQTMSGGGRVAAIRDEQGNTVVTHYITVTDQLDTTDSVQVSTGSDEGGDPEPRHVLLCQPLDREGQMEEADNVVTRSRLTQDHF
jgi:hypothetical protein